MRFCSTLMTGAVVLAVPTLAHAGILAYDNTTNQHMSPGGPFDPPMPVYLQQSGNLALNEITVSGGGSLQSLTFSAAHVHVAGPTFPPITPMATVHLFLDDGDHNPDNNGDGVADPEHLLFESSPITLPEIPSEESLLHTLDTSGEGVVIPEDATLWVGVQFNDDMELAGQALYEDPAIGSTTARFWSPDDGVTMDDPGIGVGFAMTVPGPAGIALLGLWGIAPRRRRRNGSARQRD